MILLIFVGQVLSAPLITNSNCQNDPSAHSMMQMESMQMSSMDMKTMQNYDRASMAMDCCDEECDCPMDMCLTVLIYSAEKSNVLFNLTDVYPLSITSFTYLQHLSSIYRPPILS